MGYLAYIKRLVKEVKNPALFLYHLHHYANKLVPKSVAAKIAKQNLNQYTKQRADELIVETVDGSNQVVHPDMDIYKDGVAFICTPYPYAMEEYENPCLYYGKDINCLKPVLCPIDVQSEHTQGVHMSDPCIAAKGDKLICVYRETQYKDDNIYLKEISIDGKKVESSDRALLLSTKNEYVLSPAVLLTDAKLLMYHVHTDKRDSRLVLNEFDITTYHRICDKTLSIENEPLGYYLWHIGINSSDYGKRIESATCTRGLFIYVDQKDNKHLKLFTAESADGYHWQIVSEVEIPESLRQLIKFPYKSCYNPQNGGILLSFRDKKDRNRLIQVPLRGKQ